MKKYFKLLVILVFVLSITSCGYERIDAGHVGIKVNLYGDSKGVDNVTEVTGAIWYNPIRSKIYEFPTFVQNSIWTSDEQEGSRGNEEFKLTTKDGMEVKLDISLNYRIDSENVVPIFKKYRKPLKEVANTVLRNYTREGYNTAASFYTAEQIYSNRKQFETDAEQSVIKILAKEGFTVENLVVINSIRLPDAIKKSIENKVQAKQIALMKESELQQTTADANKKIEEARGRAESMIIMAEAEAKSYKIKQSSLTALLIQQQFIERWDGVLPVYGEVPTLFKSIVSK